jgi:STAS domain
MATVARSDGQVTVPVVKIRIRNELTEAAVARLSTELAAAVVLRPRVLIVDLAQCPYVASDSIRLLLQARRAVEVAGGRMILLFAPACFVPETGRGHQTYAPRAPGRPLTSFRSFAGGGRRPGGHRP